MSEWKEYKVEDIISEISMGPFGSDVKKEVYTSFGVPILNGSNLQGFKLKEDSFGYVSEEKANSLKKCNAYRGDIVVTHRGTLGQIVYIPNNSKFDRYVISQSQFRFTCNNDIVRPDFLVYLFHTKEGQHKILSNASQVGVPALARATTTFRQIKVKIPSLSVQTKIANILSSLDDKIEVNRRINELLEELAGALFKSWFVDFEPFKDGEFVDSELGMIPKGWKVGTLGNIASITSGKRPPIKQTEMSKDVNIPLIGASSIMGYTNAILYDSKILVIGRVGTHGVVQRFGIPCWPSDNTLIITSKYYEYSYQILKTIDYKSLNRGSTQPLITQTDIKNQQVILPPENVLLDFEFIILALMNKADNNLKEIHHLTTLRDTLLPKLMSGEIDVNEVKI